MTKYIREYKFSHFYYDRRIRKNNSHARNVSNII